VIRRLSLQWPDPSPFRDDPARAIRILAVSDEPDAALDRAENREDLGAVDLVVGCGDLEPDYLAFVADAFHAPLLYVRGNHDRGANWEHGSKALPLPVAAGRPQIAAGLRIVGFSWPSPDPLTAHRDELGAWTQALKVFLRASAHRGPLLVLSHVPPTGCGDMPGDAYHAGFSGYRWLAAHVHAPLWLHGHTPLGVGVPWRMDTKRTTYANVTGGVLVELTPPGSSAASAGQASVE